MNIIDKNLESRALEELKANSKAEITIQLSYPDLISIIGALQLALRHPYNNKGPLPERVRLFIKNVKPLFAGMPALREVIERGDDPVFDWEPGEDGS